MNKANDDKNMVVESWDSSEYLSWGKGMQNSECMNYKTVKSK